LLHPLPRLHDRRQSCSDGRDSSKLGRDLGAEKASHNCPHASHCRIPDACCSVLHRSAPCTRPDTQPAQGLLCRVAAARYRNQYCLAGSLTRIIGSQTARAPRPCSWPLHTSYHWGYSTPTFCGQPQRFSTLGLRLSRVCPGFGAGQCPAAAFLLRS
jgi:hypothetical protein